MGCCQTCGLSYTRPKGLSPLTVKRLGIEEVRGCILSAPITPSTGGESSSLGLDAKSEDIKRNVAEMTQWADWKVVVDDPVCQVKSLLLGDNQHASVPVFMLVVDFGVDVELSTVRRALYDPGTRMEWDESVLEFREVEEGPRDAIVYSVTKMPFPFKNRDFAERRVIEDSSESTTIVHYSLPIDSPYFAPSEQYERAEECFSHARIQRVEGATRLLLISQCDLKLPVGQSSLILQAAIQLKNWARLLQKKVLQLDK